MWTPIPEASVVNSSYPSVVSEPSDVGEPSRRRRRSVQCDQCLGTGVIEDEDDAKWPCPWCQNPEYTSTSSTADPKVVHDCVMNTLVPKSIIPAEFPMRLTDFLARYDWSLVPGATVTNWCGIVGREPSAARGILIDPGASINIHGSRWKEMHIEQVLDPNGLEVRSGPGHAKVTGVSGGPEGSSILNEVPVALKGYDEETGEPVEIIIGDYIAHEIHGDCPALWCLSSLMSVDAILYCVACLLSIMHKGRRVVLPLQHTESGHLILPTDNWDKSSIELHTKRLQDILVFEDSVLLMASDDKVIDFMTGSDANTSVVKTEPEVVMPTYEAWNTYDELDEVFGPKQSKEHLTEREQYRLELEHIIR